MGRRQRDGASDDGVQGRLPRGPALTIPVVILCAVPFVTAGIGTGAALLYLAIRARSRVLGAVAGAFYAMLAALVFLLTAVQGPVSGPYLWAGEALMAGLVIGGVAAIAVALAVAGAARGYTWQQAVPPDRSRPRRLLPLSEPLWWILARVGFVVVCVGSFGLLSWAAAAVAAALRRDVSLVLWAVVYALAGVAALTLGIGSETSVTHSVSFTVVMILMLAPPAHLAALSADRAGVVIRRG